ncbi:hypothetical protein VW35_01720 [Devosia soli]|uniref:Uncharacterized protein n=1 Tax=Devosia soli TaxID=361041 RepID=A0A0F5LFD9_9HYPH|nr:efflux RND transporter periplasmic adaptor subunit [Devosia soli]KKB80929.1 hypothetical protein VW35_01720 [Devosia soli]
MRHLASIMLLPLLVSACGQAPEQPETAVVRPILSLVVEARPVSSSTFVGTVEPRVTTSLAFRTSGTLVSREVEVGARVLKDEVLATLDSTTLQLALRNAQANLASAQAQAANAASSQTRLESLVETNNAAQADLDQSRQQTQAAEAGVVQAQAAVSQAEEQLSYARLTAPSDGVVTDVGAEPGEVIAAGTPVLTLADPNQRDLVIDVPGDFVDGIAVGTIFDVMPQLDPAAAIAGSVREIAPQADPVTRTWRVHIALDSPPASFWLGTTATASLKASDGTALSVPQSSIRYDGDETAVWVIDEAAQTVSLRPVKIGEALNGLVPVEDGLKAGERIAVAGVNSLTEGQKVRLGGKEQQ